MNPPAIDVLKLLKANRLGSALRGDALVFETPEYINDDMRPTDHDQLLEQALYPLAIQYGIAFIRGGLEKAIQGICTDALGTFCAIQCFYIEIIREDARLSELKLDRKNLAPLLANKFLEVAPELCSLEIRKGDLAVKRSYRVTLLRMRILARDHGIDWKVVLPAL